MVVYGTCGHELKNIGGNPIIHTDQNREGELCLSYDCVCDECLKWWQKKRLLIKNVKLWKKRHWGIIE
jgi:hypothetical protein